MMDLLGSIFGVNLQQMQHQMYQGPFKGKFHAYSPAFWNSETRDKLETGDKIVVPASVLEEVSRLQVTFPIMFRITHDSDVLPKKSHCSVLEFTAEEGSVYLPLWMMDNLGLDPSGSSVIELETVTLPKGNFVQFQAHETQFAMLNNPRVVLEKSLRSYSALTVGDTILVQFGNKTYKLDVTDVKPKSGGGEDIPFAISIIETDINVDFKEPRDYKKWEKEQKEMKDAAKKQMDPSFDSKYPEENEDEDWVLDPAKDINDKSGYFNGLEQHGAKGNALKGPKSPKNLSSNTLSSATNSHGNKNSNSNSNNKSKNTTNNNSNSNSNSNSNGNSQYTSHSTSYTIPSKVRGAPLGSIHKSTPLENSHIHAKASRKEEEVVGNMRYIYEVDELGNRTCVRKLPVRNNTWTNSDGHKLQE